MGVDYFLSVYRGSSLRAVSGRRLTFIMVLRIARQSLHGPPLVFDPGRLTISSLYRPAFAPIGCVGQGGADLVDKSVDLWKNSHLRTMPAAREDAPSCSPEKASDGVRDSALVVCHTADKVPATVRTCRKRSTWNRHLGIDSEQN